MASAEKLKQIIDLHDLAHRLGMERPDPDGNYRAPNRKDRHPSVSLFDGEQAGHMMWKDHASGEKGSCIDLVIYCGRADDASEAMTFLHDEYDLSRDEIVPLAPQKKSQMEWLADKQLAVANDARAYLIDQRGIPEVMVNFLQKRRAFGFSDWTNPEKSPGDLGYGGPAISFPTDACFPVKSSGLIIAILIRL
ncbi:hypothetical protein P4S72_27010 [Vibrio sp. PP-XX7]